MKNDEKSFENLLDVFKIRLPVNFRIVESSPYAKDLEMLLENKILPGLKNLKDAEGNCVPLPFKLPWYPSNLVYQYNANKTDLRRVEEYESLKSLLIKSTDCGHVTRQEAVSLIPVLFADIKSDSRILEMCAAPGSKTTQIIESLESEIKKDGENVSIEKRGFLVCNDVNAKRMHMLIGRTKPLSCSRAVYVCHDARFFPNLHDTVFSLENILLSFLFIKIKDSIHSV